MAGKYEKPTETIKLRGCSHDPVCWNGNRDVFDVLK